MTTAEKQHFDVTGALAGRTATVDQIVADAWRDTLAASAPSGAALLAVGGYGRRELFPYSDVDLLLLFANQRIPESGRDAISAFQQRLWDAGLRISNSVRTPEECTQLHERNIELNVSLLDQRFLTGDAALYQTLAERLPKFVQGQRDNLARHLFVLTRDRHSRFQDTYHHLEPNIKEAPGGLRDLQLLGWLNQIGAASLTHPAEIEEARNYLFLLRTLLHQQAGRDSNVLTFDAQEWVADQLGRDPAAVMRDYFRHARVVNRLVLRRVETGEARASSLFAQFRDRSTRLSNTDFTVLRGKVHFRTPQQLDADPALLLRLLQFVARHGIRFSGEAEEQIASRLPAIRAHFAQRQALWPAIDEILTLPNAILALRVAHETGVLEAIFPEMEQIDCLVVRDFYHRYTVDEHTLVAIQTLTKLPDPLYADLLSELERPALVMFALLLHDIGKGSPDEGHVDASARLAEQIMHRIGVPEADRETVLFLIRAHLELSSTMNSRDLFDPATAEHLAHRVETVERLKALTLLTYADISAVTPAAMTPWRAEQLWRLYLVAHNELTRELENERIERADASARSAFLEGLPTRYLRTHRESEMDAHVRMEEESRQRGVSLNLEKQGSVYRLTLVTADRPFLFAAVAGTLASFGLNILKAEAFANRRGTVVDMFTFADPVRTLELNPSEVERLKITMERVVLGRADVRQLLKSRPRLPAPSRKARIEPTVAIDSQASAMATLIQIVAQDRPALLYDITSTISSNGCNIEVVLIDTEAHKAIDVFYVTREGRKLPAEMHAQLRDALLQCLA